MQKKKLFLRAQEVSELLGVSMTTTYDLIREMNEELKEKGFMVINGRIPTKYFEEKFYGVSEVVEIPVEEREEWFHA